MIILNQTYSLIVAAVFIFGKKKFQPLQPKLLRGAFFSIMPSDLWMSTGLHVYQVSLCVSVSAGDWSGVVQWVPWANKAGPERKGQAFSRDLQLLRTLDSSLGEGEMLSLPHPSCLVYTPSSPPVSHCVTPMSDIITCLCRYKQHPS